MGELDPLRIAGLRARIQTERLSRLDRGLSALESADPEFRPLQIGDDPDRPFVRTLDLADRLDASVVLGSGAMAEIEPKYIRASSKQRFDLLGRAAGRPERCNDLGIAAARPQNLVSALGGHR